MPAPRFPLCVAVLALSVACTAAPTQTSAPTSRPATLPTATALPSADATATPAPTARPTAPPAAAAPTVTAPTVTAPARPPTGAATAGPTELPRVVVGLQRADGSRVEVSVEVAADQASRQRGLMFRPSLPAQAGMLFVFPDDTDGPFWMMDTYVPLSIAFIAADGRIVSIKDMQPRSTDLTYPGARYRYALEVNQGFFDRAGVRAGDRAQIPR